MILSFINIRKVPREILKTSGFALGFQHLARDLANVNEWKIMFDHYNMIQLFPYSATFSSIAIEVKCCGIRQQSAVELCSMMEKYSAG